MLNLFVNVANAQTASKVLKDNPAIKGIFDKVSDNIVFPIVTVIFTLAFFVFVYGIFGMITSKDDSEKRENGKNSILWGVIGMTIMLSVYGILNLIVDTLGVDNPLR